MCSGTVIRAMLRPAGEGLVTIVAWYRREPDGRWQRRPQEERTVSFGTLGLSTTYEDLFGDN